MIPKQPLIHTIQLIALCLLLGSCTLIQQRITPSDDSDDYPRAFFVERQATMRADNQFVRMRASMDDVARAVSNVLEEVTDTTVNVLRVPEGQVAFGNMQPLMRISTPKLTVETLEDFREFFSVGEYLLDREDYTVRAENLSYRVEAILYLRGQELIVNFTVDGDLQWNIYQKTSRNERKISRDDRVKYAVGAYRYQQPIERVNWRGNTYETFEWVVVDINDRPVSKGKLEHKLRTKLIEFSAVENISASIINRY